jgi:hypothetical protein
MNLSFNDIYYISSYHMAFPINMDPEQYYSWMHVSLTVQSFLLELCQT